MWNTYIERKKDKKKEKKLQVKNNHLVQYCIVQYHVRV